MAVPKVDFKMGTAVVAQYDGNSSNLRSFVDSTLLFKDSVEADFVNSTAEQKTAADEANLKNLQMQYWPN